jgi:hypothetical protein
VGCAKVFTAVQKAIDTATEGETIKIASGVYTRVNNYGASAQIAYLSKTVTLRGGYTVTNWVTPDVQLNPTVLDAQSQGRGLYITGSISPVIEGLTIVGGNPIGDDFGGGICVTYAAAVLRNNTIVSNTAQYGAGIHLSFSEAEISGNTIMSNVALSQGGGLGIDDSQVTLDQNTIAFNTADTSGGGIICNHSDATITGNTIQHNVTDDSGGGLYVALHSNVTLTRNVIVANRANGLNPMSGGGGLYLYASQNATLSGNTFISNAAALKGGAIYLYYSDVTMTNTLVADNQAGNAGSGLCVQASSPRLLHTTLARNTGGSADGLYVTHHLDNYSHVTLVNTILVTHTTGVSVTDGNTLTVDGILWHTIPVTISRSVSATVGVQNQRWGDPAFVDSDAGDYHLDFGSVAIDWGAETTVGTDFDGDPRPIGKGYDVGCDEYTGHVEYIYLPLVLWSD